MERTHMMTGRSFSPTRLLAKVRDAISRMAAPRPRLALSVLVLLAAAVTESRAQTPTPLAGRVFGSGSEALVVVLHGDLSDGSPADYHQDFARDVAAWNPGATVVALIRPGYADSTGLQSPGSNNGRRDHYTAENNDLLAETIRNLRNQTGAGHVIGLGHSGGAAQLGAVIGRYPRLVDSAILVGCPCDIPRWRATRGGPWPNSQSPQDFIGGIAAGTRIVALTGSLDTNTFPDLGRDYVAAARARGLPARFDLVAGAGHNFSPLRTASHAAVTQEIAAWRAAPRRPEHLLGGGAIFAQTDDCAPALGTHPHPVSISYSPSELGGLPSGVSLVWRDGSEHLALWGAMQPSGQFFGAAGRATWSRFVYYPTRPLIRIVQRLIVEPAGGADLEAAHEILLRLRVQNFAAIRGCSVSLAATLRRPE